MCGFKLVITLASVLMRSSVVFPEGKALFSQEQCVFSQKKLISTNDIWKGEVAVEVLGSDYGEWLWGEGTYLQVSGTEEHLDNARAYDVPGTGV